MWIFWTIFSINCTVCKRTAVANCAIDFIELTGWNSKEKETLTITNEFLLTVFAVAE
jgi:hypothetical protein